ncbi:MAG: subtilin biosynthesis sensor protein SpaK [Lachnospiraceae bacterium]|jgi:hypothetical protein|uniref:subtilin biosynthesis sensor protein SpaK n=1 Tax=Roseburia sp. 1XD42-69 TaxID=2320088 RepID=UPI000EA3738B|nr:subtilin biosynthesis sensor protein SpaK [Roseburia sp. 1XD42-69]MCI8876259.1 subtilin biosynthesis sensor protein SpaK [Lachnospiraceae bacterium]RKJ67821.1 subtilin biosynthesis sensor protein SpaK [Roseburia sp. 1XD42-69]
MGYHTVDELEHFNFAGAEILEIREYRDQLIFELGFVTILPENTCNRDVREMGTSQLTLKLFHVKEIEIILEGYKVFDADGNLKETCEDEVIKNKDFPALYQDLKGSGIYSLKRDGDDYVFYLDAEERTYRFTVKAKGNSQDWERFMNKNPVY